MAMYHGKPMIEPGMWVRFEAGGRLVVGVVAYVRPNASGHLYVYTEHGSVAIEAILEARG